MVPVVTGTIGLIAAITIILLIRKDQLHVRDGLGWMFVAVVIALVGVFPNSFDWLAGLLGIAYGPVLALTLGITALVIKALLADIARSRTEARLQRLVQKVAFLEAQLYQQSRDDAQDPEQPGS